MSRPTGRRGFLKRTIAASAGAALSLSFEERVLLAKDEKKAPQPARAAEVKAMPTGKIGNVTVARLICGGNLISGFAHSRDLIYVSPLLRHYFSDDKIMETLQLCEQNGINTAILRLDERTRKILNKYWQERGGKMQWIAQVKPRERDLTSDTKDAIDNGAIGVYVQGEVGDRFVANGRVDLLAKSLECIQDNGVIGGIGAHALDVIVACEKAGLKPDFYMKTINSKQYWSAGPVPRNDSVWEETPAQTIEFMKTVDKPWIGFKVLGAGAIEPREGFEYAFANGADFICVGMFDFQVDEDADIARNMLASDIKRARPWRA